MTLQFGVSPYDRCPNTRERFHVVDAAGYIRGELVERLQLRRTPDLHYTLDHSQEYVERIDKLLKEVKKDKPSSSA